jgi:hypothetical protein
MRGGFRDRPIAGPQPPLLAGNVLLVTQCYVARGDFRNEKMHFNPFPGTAEAEDRSDFQKL